MLDVFSLYKNMICIHIHPASDSSIPLAIEINIGVLGCNHVTHIKESLLLRPHFLTVALFN